MKYLRLVSVIIWLCAIWLFGYNFGWDKNEKNWDKFLQNKIVANVPKGSIIIERGDGYFFLGRITDKKTKDGLIERFNNGMEIEVLK